MHEHRSLKWIVAGLSLWIGLYFLGRTNPTIPPNSAKYSLVTSLFAGVGSDLSSSILAVGGDCDTSITGAKYGLDKPNQSKLFFHDSTWWMLSVRAATNKWNLWRYDSLWIWTPVFEFPVSRKDRPDAILDATNNRVFIFFSSKTASSLYELAYNDAAKSWTQTAVSGVPGIFSVSDNPASFVRAHNGDLWVFAVNGGKVIGMRSTDDGATWSSAVTLLGTLASTLGLTDAVAFTDSGGLSSIAVGVAENTTTGAWFHFLVHHDADPINVWSDETSNVAPLGSEVADDHLAMAVDELDNVYMITKTNGGGASIPENTLYIRSKAYAVCDTSIENTKQGLEKPNQSKLFFYDGKWWLLSLRASTNTWVLWRYAGGITWSLAYDFGVGSKNNPDGHIDTTAGKLYILFSSKTGTTSTLWTLSYNAIAETWSKDSESTVPGVYTVADDPASFVVAKNGDFWAFTMDDSQLVAVHSSNGGVSWSTPIIIADTLNVNYGLTDAIAFTAASAANYVAVAVGENAGTHSRFHFYLHKDGDPDAVWTDESANLAPIAAERADDHINLVVDAANSVYLMVKTTGGGVNTPENVLYKRSNAGAWQSFVVMNGISWTRPAMVIDADSDSLYIFATRETAATGKVIEYKRCKIGEESTLETATPQPVLDNGTDFYMNVVVPALPVTDGSELMVAADNETQGNVWFRRLSIGTPVPCPSLSPWRSYVVIEGTGWTRPGIVIDDQHDSLYVFGSRETASIGKVVQYKSCKIGEEYSLEAQTPQTIIDHGTDDFLNLSLPAHSVHDTTELMIIAGNQDSLDVWFTRLPIGAAPPCSFTLDTTVTLTIDRLGNDVRLSWNTVAFADSYVVYRGFTPMFSPDTARLASVTTAEYIDAGALGDPNVNHFYMVRAYINGGAGPLSQRVGEFEYALVSPPGKTNNFIALCLRDSSIQMASDFVTRIGPSVDLVSRWIEPVQAWGSYIPGLSFTDFPVEFNGVYMISVTQADTLLLLGEVPTGHQYALVTSSTGKNNNGMMLLMDADSITTASQLTAAIGPVELVSRWIPSVQAWGSYIPGLSFTDFAISFAQPLMVSVTADTTWPQR